MKRTYGQGSLPRKAARVEKGFIASRILNFELIGKLPNYLVDPSGHANMLEV